MGGYRIHTVGVIGSTQWGLSDSHIGDYRIHTVGGIGSTQWGLSDPRSGGLSDPHIGVYRIYIEGVIGSTQWSLSNPHNGGYRIHTQSSLYVYHLYLWCKVDCHPVTRTKIISLQQQRKQPSLLSRNNNLSIS